jgi:M6 family metalloprotease-like protein
MQPDSLINGALQATRAIGPQRLIVIPVEFPDIKHHTKIESIREIVFRQLNDFYIETSYGLVSITGTIAGRWYQTQTPLTKLSVEKWNYKLEDMDLFEQEAINAASSDVYLRDYDFVVLVGAGHVWPHAKCSLVTNPNDDSRPLRGIVVNEGASMETYAHELGHVLPTSYRPRDGCGLPDLYSYQASEKGQESDIFVGPWDIMSASDSPKHFSAWSKIMLGWLTPEVARLNKTSLLPVTLQPLEINTGTRVILIPLSDTKYYVIEMRRRIGYDRYLPSEGVLVYSVDTSVKDGYGPIRVVNSHPSTLTLDNAPFNPGSSFEDVNDNVYMVVAYAQGGGFLTLLAGSEMYPSQGTNQGDLLVGFVTADIQEFQ